MTCLYHKKNNEAKAYNAFAFSFFCKLMKHISLTLLLTFLFTVSIHAEQSKKSPIKSFLMSLVLPGAGQYYNGNTFSSGVYLVSETVLAGGYYYYDNETDHLITKYKNYADTHFYYSGNDPDRKSYYEMWPILKDRVYAKENLPREKVGEYWELIGKLPELTVFWDTPAQQRYYYRMRQDANSSYKTSNTYLGLLALNHLISAVDAYLGAKHYNIRLSSSLNESEMTFAVETTF